MATMVVGKGGDALLVQYLHRQSSLSITNMSRWGSIRAQRAAQMGRETMDVFIL